MIHHISIAVKNIDRAAVFYDAALKELGYDRVVSTGSWIGWGVEAKEDKFAIKATGRRIRIPGAGFHIAFAAPSREAVRRFYRAALASGGRDNGRPSLYSEYDPNYYAAYVFDPDGYRIEVVISYIYDEKGYKLRPVTA